MCSGKKFFNQEFNNLYKRHPWNPNVNGTKGRVVCEKNLKSPIQNISPGGAKW